MKPYRSADYTDEMLLDLIRLEDDRSAFAELYGRYWDKLLDAAYQRLKSVEPAQEIVQEIFIDFFLRRTSIQVKSTVEAYLKRALKYKVYNIYRSQQVHFSYVDSMLKKTDIDAVTPQHTLEAKELKERIYRTAEKMPEKCREVFLLSRFENLSNQAISDRLGISVSTVKKHLTKAMNMVRKDFEGYKFDLVLIFIYMMFR